jgi:hypothetical protein
MQGGIAIRMSEIELDLRKHCIETAIKRLRSRLLSEYFRSKGKDAASEAKLAMLQNALMRFDFPALRAAHRELAGKSDARILLTDVGGSTPGIAIGGRRIDTKLFIRG